MRPSLIALLSAAVLTAGPVQNAFCAGAQALMAPEALATWVAMKSINGGDSTS